jgi:hypothetical protein
VFCRFVQARLTSITDDRDDFLILIGSARKLRIRRASAMLRGMFCKVPAGAERSSPGLLRSSWFCSIEAKPPNHGIELTRTWQSFNF